MQYGRAILDKMPAALIQVHDRILAATRANKGLHWKIVQMEDEKRTGETHRLRA